MRICLNCLFNSSTDFIVYNNGNANAENPFTVNFFIGDYSNVAAVDTVKSLAVGDSVLVAGLWKYPASGTFNIQVYADFPDKVTEPILVTVVTLLELPVY